MSVQKLTVFFVGMAAISLVANFPAALGHSKMWQIAFFGVCALVCVSYSIYKDIRGSNL